MRQIYGKAVNGKIEIPEELPEGTAVIVLAPEEFKPKTLDPRLESLLESIEEELGRDMAGFVRRGFSRTTSRPRLILPAFTRKAAA